MHSPRAALDLGAANGSQQNSAVPQLNGKALPKDPKELMRLLQLRVKGSGSNSLVNDRISRVTQQGIDRELNEAKLMSFEDFMYNANSPEAISRIKRSEERTKMESEDILSQQLEALLRQADFKVRVRREAEDRKRRELAEREEKRKEAEIRRQAVVERIRKKQEEEERAAREAELALQRIQQEKLREAERLKMILKRDRDGMAMEDELSRLLEQDRKDELARKLWREQEAKRVAEWEREQAEKDKLEQLEREKRQAELDEKKRKLMELKQSQNAQSADMAAALAAAQEENNKLTKQMRIQNKAKFVTKKLKAGSSADEVVAATAQINPNTGGGNVVVVGNEDDLGIGPVSSSTLNNATGGGPGASERNLHNLLNTPDGGQGNQAPTDGQKSFRLAPASFVLPTSNASAAEEEPVITVPLEFTQLLDKITTEQEIKSLQKQLMAEKRALRLQQQQQVGADISEVKLIRGKLTILNKEEELITLKLTSIVKKKKEENSVVRSMNETKAPDAGAAIPVATNANATKAEAIDQVMPSGVGASSASSTIAPKTEDADSAKFKKAEALLKESTAMLESVSQKGFSSQADRQAALVLAMEASEIARTLSTDSDTFGYKEKLQKCGAALKSAAMTAAINVTTATVPEPSVSTNQPVTQSTPVPAPVSDVSATKEMKSPRPQRSPRPAPASEPPTEVQKAAILVIQQQQTNTVGPESKQSSGEISKDQPNSTEDSNEASNLDFEALPGWNDCLYTSMATAAHHAAYYGYVEVLEFLSREFDCFVMDQKGRTPLFYAALANRLDCVVALVSLDPQWIDVGDEKGDTPLHSAAISNGVQVLKFLLSACEVSPDTANHEGLTPSHLAKTAAALQVLYEYGGMPYCVDSKSRLPLHIACKDGRVECVNFLCHVTPPQYLLWGDNEGNTCLHEASSNNHAPCVEEVCRWTSGVEDLCVVNKKGMTAAHVASSATVLKTLYEQGANLWILDAKGRYPLFITSFVGKLDCVAFLVDVAVSAAKTELVAARDAAGDTALHAAALKGHLQCVELLAYYLRNVPNNHHLTPSQLADKAGHPRISIMIQYYESQFAAGLTADQVFECSFDTLSSNLLYYGSRWTRLFDPGSGAVYFYDRITGSSSWEAGITYDGNADEDWRTDQARDLLIKFYNRYNSQKLSEINDILQAYKGKYTELFISLANKYEIEDLTMFAGISFED